MKTIQVVNALIIDESLRVLLLQRSVKLKNAGMWGMPGGLIDDGEEQLSAMLREVAEETGIQLGSKAIISTSDRTERESDEDVYIVTYICTAPTDKTITLDPYEHQSYGWFSVDELSGIQLLSGQAEVIKTIVADRST